jgi:hypothetical protein
MAKNEKMSEQHRQFLKYSSMTTEELAEATKEFDQEFIVDKSRPLSREARALWLRAKRKVGRPRMGKGAKRISLSVEEGLLAESDALARRLNIPRAQLVARCLRAALAAEGKR